MKIRFLNTHPYHLVDISPWPILMSFGLLSGALALVNWLTLGSNNKILNIIIVLNVILILISWFRDIVREAMGGFHTIKVQEGIMLGFLIFLITEVLLFISLFWGYFHSSLNPSVEIVTWPPLGVNAVNYLSLPLLNSVLLLSGGFLATWGHHAFIYHDRLKANLGLILAKILTVIFLIIQYIEYSYSEFTITDSVYGSIFFITTGLHFIHVLVALIFVGFANYKIMTNGVTSEHALILDTSLIYYHLVDIVWLFVYIVYYYFGS